MISNLYQKMNYLANLKFIKSVNITEYDISKANISSLFQAGVLNNETYNYLYRLPKHDREVYVGNMILHDRSVYETIQNGIIEAKHQLFLQNQIKETEVIRIANDAVFILRNTPLEFTTFNLMEFKVKKQYSLFCRLQGITILFGCKMGDIEIEVIGLGNQEMAYHANYMLTFIGNLFYLLENNTLAQVLDYFLGFYNQYLRKELDIGYYRELNENSLFTVNAPKNNGKFGMLYTESLDGIDISYNAGVLRELYGFINMCR